MEISERELRGLVRAVDEHHHDGMATMAHDVAELHAATRPLRRRDLLRNAAIGAGALVIGAASVPFTSLLPAAAQEKKQVLKDADLAAFAESVELAAVQAYQLAAATGKVPKPLSDLGTLFASHHQQHAQAFAALAGSSGKHQPNAVLLATVSGQLRDALSETAVLQVAFDLENAAASTYLNFVGLFQATDGRVLAASILPVESEHAAAIGQAMGKTGTALFPKGNTAAGASGSFSFETTDQAIDPTKFTILPTTTTTAK